MNLKVLFWLSLLVTQTTLAASWKDNKLITPKHPCIKDVAKFCATATPDESNRWSCLGKNFNNLTPACSVFMKGIYKTTNDCADDIFKLCTGANANYGKWVDCLKSQKKVTPKCQALLAKGSKKEELREKFQRTCQADFEKLCPKLTGEALANCTRAIFQKTPEKYSKDCLSAKNNMVGDTAKK